jgi:hypothetical protein
MRNREYPSDEIIQRAAHLWAEMMRQPKFDNGDPSFAGAMTKVLHDDVVAAQSAKVPDIEAAIGKFETELVVHLQTLRDKDGEPMSPEDAAWDQKATNRREGEKATYWWRAILGVDYHPDLTLRYAAERAGLPSSLFSWKTTMFMTTRYVSCSIGYGAPDEYHYPLGAGRWLITDLRCDGKDIEAVKAAVLDGRLPELRVETAKVGVRLP